MEFKVLCFGITREIIGAEELRMTMDEKEMPVSEFRENLLSEYPLLKKISSLLLAVNDEYAADDQLIHEKDIVALIPPVAGG